MGKTGAESEATAMKNDERATGAKTMLWSVAARLFFVFFYGYVWLIIEPRLIHHSLGIQSFYDRFAFHTDWSFFQEHLARVGGPVEYAARLLSQCYRWDWAGALIVTAVAWCASLGADFVTGRDGRSRGRVLRYVPAAMLLVMVGGYLHPLNAVLSLLAAFAGYVGYVRWAPQAPARRLLVLLLAAVALYWFAGSGSLLFPILVALEERVISGRKSLAAAAVLCMLSPSRHADHDRLCRLPGLGPGSSARTMVLHAGPLSVLSHPARGNGLLGSGAGSPGSIQPRPPGAEGQRVGRGKDALCITRKGLACRDDCGHRLLSGSRRRHVDLAGRVDPQHAGDRLLLAAPAVG
jgi:hypothetical protein